MPGLESLQIRSMSLEEVGIAVDMAAQEGWNPGLNDAACFYTVDPAGFIGAFLDGRLAGCISAVQYDQNFAFAGFFLVKPELRGRGIGGRLIEAGAAHLTALCCGNDGVVTQQDNYRKLGFVTAHRNIRYAGSAAGDPAAVDSAARSAGLLQPLERLDFDAIAAFDYQHFKAPRRLFLECWIKQPGSRALAFVENGAIKGCGVIRQCRQGCKIGPLFAQEPDIAECVYVGLVEQCAGGTVMLDTPEPNRAARDLAERHGLKPVFETARMYKGQEPGLPLEHIYGITSFELG